MTLPKISLPTYTLDLPSSGKTVEYRPYTVGEEKVLLTALQGEDAVEIENNILKIVDACTFNKLDCANIPSFDFEYLFINIRSKSVGNMVELRYRMNNCSNSPDDNGYCASQISLNINLDEVEVITHSGSNRDINIAGDISVRMRFPTTREFNDASKHGSLVDRVEHLSKSCIEMVYDGDNVYSDFTKEELDEFYDGMTSEQKAKLAGFIESIPTIQHKTTLSCHKCDRSEDITVEGLVGFFG